MSLCPTAFNVANTVFTVISVISFTSIIYGCYVVYSKKEELSNKSKFFRIILIFTTIITIGCYPLIAWIPCISGADSVSPAWSICFGIQCTISTVIFYCKVLIVFEGSAFKISKCLQNVFIFLYIISAIGIILMVISAIIFGVRGDDAHYFQLLAALLLLIYIIVMISLTVLFINKLIIVYRNSERNNEILVTPITRLTILISVSMIVCVSEIVGILLHTFLPTWFTALISQCCGLTLLCTNFVNAMLINKAYETYYKIICGSLDGICRRCWMTRINDDDDATQLSMVVNDIPSETVETPVV